VRHIDLPGSLDEAGSVDQNPALKHDTRVDKGSRIAGDENEQIGGVAEPVVPLGNPVDRVVRTVVEKDRLIGNTAQQVEAIVANLRRQNHLDCHGYCSLVLFTKRHLRLERPGDQMLGTSNAALAPVTSTSNLLPCRNMPATLMAHHPIR
jgi:hypothetical protein